MIDNYDVDIVDLCKSSKTKVIVSVSGHNIVSLNSKGVVSTEFSEVKDSDIIKVLEVSKALPTSSDKNVIHAIPQLFTVDGIEGIRNPLHMMASRLEVSSHIVTIANTSIQNTIKTINRASIDISSIQWSGIAAARSVLTEEDESMGIMMLNIGAGKIDIVVFKDGYLAYSSVFPLGGNIITKDIAYVWKIPEEVAESVKCTSGCAYSKMIDDEDIIIPSMGSRSAQNKSSKELSLIIEDRVLEFFHIIKKEHLEPNKLLDKINGGIVLTGGGAMQLGIIELAEAYFKVPARLGLISRNLGDIDDEYNRASYSTVFGLFMSHLAPYDWELNYNFNEFKNNKNELKKSQKIPKQNKAPMRNTEFKKQESVVVKWWRLLRDQF